MPPDEAGVARALWPLDERGREAAERDRRVGVGVKGVGVLVVDDEPDPRALVERLLEDCGAVVTAADPGDEVRGLVRDIAMPVTEGYA